MSRICCTDPHATLTTVTPRKRFGAQIGRDRAATARRRQASKTSPSSATRSSTCSNGTARARASSSAPASTSSQVERRGDGGPLPAAQGVGRDGRLRAGVLRPVEEHLARPLGLGHRRGHQRRRAPSELLGDLLGQRGRARREVQLAGQGGVEVQALAAAGDRRQSRSRSASASRTSSATCAHSCSPAGSPGSRSMTSRSGLRGRPLRRPSTGGRAARGRRGWPARSASRGRRRSGSAGVAVCPGRGARAGGRHRRRTHPRRRAGRRVLLEEARCPRRRAASGSG